MPLLELHNISQLWKNSSTAYTPTLIVSYHMPIQGETEPEGKCCVENIE